MYTHENVEAGLGLYLRSKDDINYLMKNSTIPRKMTTKFFAGYKFYNGEAVGKQFLRQRNQQVVGSKKTLAGKKIVSVPVSTLSKNMVDQIKLPHKIFEAVEKPGSKTCVTLLLHRVNKRESS